MNATNLMAATAIGLSSAALAISLTNNNQGPTGVSGIQGEIGMSGASGSSVQGVSGQPGEIGVSGQPGEMGVTGQQGVSGISGQQGVSGLQGASGLQGVSGVSGLQGVSGTSGVQGASGASGVLAVPNVQFSRDSVVVTTSGVDVLLTDAGPFSGVLGKTYYFSFNGMFFASPGEALNIFVALEKNGVVVGSTQREVTYSVDTQGLAVNLVFTYVDSGAATWQVVWRTSGGDGTGHNENFVLDVLTLN